MIVHYQRKSDPLTCLAGVLRFYRKLPTLETIIIEVYLPARLSTLLNVGIGRCVLFSCSMYRSKRAIRESRSQKEPRRGLCSAQLLRISEAKETYRSFVRILVEPRRAAFSVF